MKLVRDILDSKAMGNIISVAPSATVLQAIEVLASGNFGALPIMSGSELVGIFSERDYARKVTLKGKQAHEIKVESVMTANPVCVTPDHSLEDCMRLMTEKGFRHLPVVSDKKLLGMISIKDAVKAVLLGKEALMNDMVSIGSQKQEEKDRTLQKMIDIFDTQLELVSREVKSLSGAKCGELKSSFEIMSRAVEDLRAQHQFKKKFHSTKVLLATDNPSESVIAKMALGGTGVELDTVSSLGEGTLKLDEKPYDIVCVNSSLIDLAAKALEKNPDAKTVFMTSEDSRHYVQKLKQFPFLSNVVSQSEFDRTFSVRSILSTVGKIANEDYFGMEKYLNWGAEFHEHTVESSTSRAELIQKMEEFCKSLGIRRTLVSRCANVAEELLMNAIYDAPVDELGNLLFIKSDRKLKIDLKPEQRPVFRYGCDGLFFGISVTDPFGKLDRETILDYIESCFEEKQSNLHRDKGGGGFGLFIVFRSTHLTVFNVKKDNTTEVIALFDLDPTKDQENNRKSSFHYFSV